jgi:hypothetical protein
MRFHRKGMGFGLAVLLAAGSSAAADPPAAAPPAAPAGAAKPLSESLSGMARAEYEAGRILYADKDFGNAIVKFQKAHELANDPRLLWNIAVCQKNLRRYARMLATIRRYQHEAASLLTEEERAQSAEIVKTVESFVSGLKVTSNEAGAEVFVDEEKVGQTPLTEPVIVDVGVRKIKVVKPGFKDALLTREIVGGGQVAIDVQLEKEVHRGRLVVIAGENDIIALDGTTIGKGRWEGTTSSGGHTLKVTAPGMAAYQSEALVRDGEVRRIEVTLNPQARTDTTRTVLWVVGGAALAAGAAVGGFFLFKPSESPTVMGTIKPGSVNLSARGFQFSTGGRR